MLQSRFPMVETMKNSQKPIGFVPLEEQSVPVLNKLNNSANFNALHMNQNFFVPDNVFQDKRMQECIQQFQQCSSDNSNSTVMFHKHVNSSSVPCVVTDQNISRNPEALYTDRVPPLPSVDHQTFGPAMHQGVFNPQQFLHNNNIPANITLNCNFPSNVSGQVFSTQLPMNQCLDINAHNQTNTEIITTVSQSSNPGAFLFHTDVQNSSNQSVNNNIMTNFINPGCGQVFPVSSQDSHLPVVNSLRYTISREDNMISRQKSKKSKAKINKINSVLDRCSPCPNIDVRQIPSEHHRPPPEAFAAIGSAPGCLNSMGTIQTSNYQIVTGSNLCFSTANLNPSYLNKSVMSVAGQNLSNKSHSQGNNFFEMSKTIDSNGSNSNSPFPGSPINVNNFQTNNFQSYQDTSQLPQISTAHSQENLRNQNKILTLNSGKLSQMNQSATTSLPHSVIPTSKMQNNIDVKNFNDSTVTDNSIQKQNIDATSCINSSSISPKCSETNQLNSNINSQNVISSLPVSTINTSSGNIQFKNVNSTFNLQSFINTSSHSNVMTMSFATPQNTISNINTVHHNQNLITGSQQIRQNLSVPQQNQPVIYNNTLTNPSNHRPDQTNFFMQNTSNPTLESMTTIRPSLVQQDGSGVLVQQVLSQKLSQDYPTANIFSSTARAQMVQQVNGMVLPQSASDSNMNSQQLVLAPTQIRMSASGGLITMLPPAITSNAMMNGTQVITGPAQQMGPQMVIPENIRPNIMNQQQQILQNNCFIMSNQPTFVTRPPHTNIVNAQVPCQTSVSLPFSTGAVGNFASSQQNTNGTSIITAPIIHKTQDRNEIPTQNINTELTLQASKDQNSFATGFHVLQSSPQRLHGQKSDGSVIGQDWLQKSDTKNNIGDQANQITGFLSNVSTSRSNSVPSNIPGHTMLSNCGQVLISGENNCLNPQTVSASNISRMIPIVGGQCALNSPMPPLSVPNVTAVTTTMTQMIPAIGIAPQILGQPVQPMVQVINTVPFNSMQNAVIVPGGSNVLSQTVRLDALQTSPVVGPPAPTVFNGVVLPPNTMNCVPPHSVSNVTSLRHPHAANHDEMRITIENIHEARGTPGSNSSSSTPASSCSSTPIATSGENHNITFRALSPAVRKRTRDGKRKANTQTVASMLQSGAHNASAANANNPNSISQQQQQQQQLQQNAAQMSSLQQQFLQPPMLQTLTVLPQQPRPLLQQPVMNYNSIGSVGGHQILATGLTSPLGIVQPLSMLGVTPTGTVIQNIPVQQVMPGPHFQSLTVLQGPHTVNSLPQEQPVVVNDTSSMGVHPNQMHSAFAAGSIVPNMVTTNPVISTHVGGTEVLVTATTQSHAVSENVSQTTVPTQYPTVFPQTLPPVAQSLSSTTCSSNVKACKSGATSTTNVTSLHGQSPVVTSFVTPLTTANVAITESKEENLVSSTNESFPESNHKARSIGVQSSCTEQNAAVQTVTSTVPVSNVPLSFPDDSQNTKLSLQDSLDETKSKFEGENSSTILSSGGESCESPWPDPVNLSAAVRAVVQEQFDSNEEIISHPVSSTTQIVNFLECNTSLHEETSEEIPSSSVGDVVEESNDGNSVLDLRTMSLQSGEFSTDQDISEEANCEDACQEANESPMHLSNWNKDQLPVVKSNESSDNVVENASTASSETSEQTSSTDCNVTSDSGVESSQEPMNLACIREDNVGVELPDSDPPIGESMSVLIAYENDVNMSECDDKISKKRGIKRLRRELDVPLDDCQDEESDGEIILMISLV